MDLAHQQHLLVFRFSSLGDVAMTVPVLKILLYQHPHLHITMVSTEFLQPLFMGVDRLHFHAADIKGKHKGLPGLFRLFKELNVSGSFDAVADLHDVIRTKLLRSFFLLSGKPIAVIDKGRKEKKELTRKKSKNLHPLKSNFQRYADVFHQLGFTIQLTTEKVVSKLPLPEELYTLKNKGAILVGIAPFALHREKTYPPEKMKELIRLLNHYKQIKIYLLGGKKDANELQQWLPLYQGVESLAGRMNFKEELQYISAMDLVVSMDSANMHLASLFGVPVVSIWGGTHPFLGFYGWGQNPDNAVQVELDCRPSSVFGNKPCHNNLKCMHLISPVMIFERIINVLNLQHHEVSDY